MVIQLVTNTLGPIVGIQVRAVAIQSGDGAANLLGLLRTASPLLRQISADSGYARSKLRCWLENQGEWGL